MDALETLKGRITELLGSYTELKGKYEALEQEHQFLIEQINEVLPKQEESPIAEAVAPEYQQPTSFGFQG